MRTKKIIVLIVVIFIGNPFSFNISFGNDNNIILEKRLEEIHISKLFLELGKGVKNNKKVNKYKSLKKEIQNRKKYHKNLVNIYNISFDENYLELIKNNSILIDNLMKEL